MLGEHVREAVRSLDAVEPALRAGEALAALRHAGDARGEVEALVEYLAARARLDGAAWAGIGAQLGVSKQAAQQRYTPAADALLRTAIRAGARQAPLTTGPPPAGQACGQWCINGNGSSSDHRSGGPAQVKGGHCYCLCHDHTACGHRDDDDRYGLVRVQTHPEFFHHDAREHALDPDGDQGDDDQGVDFDGGARRPVGQLGQDDVDRLGAGGGLAPVDPAPLDKAVNTSADTPPGNVR